MCYARVLHNIKFVPKHEPVTSIDTKRISDFLLQCKRLLILTGAGISTESGIPDYRSDGVGLYARSKERPVQYQNFIKNEETRRRYWARNYVGWSKFSQFQPNSTHEIIGELQLKCNRVSCIITQNVDNLHHKAGNKNVIELHGTAYKVVCLQCSMKYDRFWIQNELKTLNPSMAETSHFIRPDGDVALTDEEYRTFKTLDCPDCNGTLKPYIVFFGENVPKERVAAVDKEIECCDSILILGSSVSTYSGFRITMKCKELGKPLAIVNIGQTRADPMADIKIERRCGELLSELQLSNLFLK